MTFLVDANVLSEATRPEPDPRVLTWLARHERDIAVDAVILGEIRFGILLLPSGKRRARLDSGNRGTRTEARAGEGVKSAPR